MKNLTNSDKDIEKMKEEIMGELSIISSKISETQKDIHEVVTPKFLNVSIQVKDLVELSIEIWRLENRINKITSNLEENQKEAILNSIQKLKRYIEKNDIEVVDHTNQRFNDGRNLDVLAVEKSQNISDPLIKETKEPTVLCKGQVVSKGKVIVLTSEEKGELGGKNE